MHLGNPLNSLLLGQKALDLMNITRMIKIRYAFDCLRWFIFLLFSPVYTHVGLHWQICWIWKKVNSEDNKGFQQFLDNVLYKSSGILRYERIFGQEFLSIGGKGMQAKLMLINIYLLYLFALTN